MQFYSSLLHCIEWNTILEWKMHPPPADNCYGQTIVLPWNLNKALSSILGRSESETPLYLLANKTHSLK